MSLKLGSGRFSYTEFPTAYCLICWKKHPKWRSYCMACTPVLKVLPMTEKQFLDVFKDKEHEIITAAFGRFVKYEGIYYAFPPGTSAYSAVIRPDGKIY